MKHSKLSQSFEDYLEAILILEEEGKAPKSVEVARLLGVSKPAVSKAMNDLAAKGYIEKESYSELRLTPEGREVANKVYHVHTTIRDFLMSIGVSEKTANVDCCLIEHVISDETLKAIENSLKKDK